MRRPTLIWHTLRAAIAAINLRLMLALLEEDLKLLRGLLTEAENDLRCFESFTHESKDAAKDRARV